MKMIRNKQTGKLSVTVKKPNNKTASESAFGTELEKQKQHKKNEEYVKGLKIEQGLRNNMLKKDDTVDLKQVSERTLKRKD